MNAIRTAASRSAARIARLVPARKSVRFLLAAAVAAVSLLGGMTLTGGSAQAATAVTGCFKWSNGAPYANQRVHLLQWTGSWTVIRNGKTNGAGCGTFYNTPGNAYLAMKATAVLDDGRYVTSYEGYSPRYVEPGNYHGGVGTGYVHANARWVSNTAIANQVINSFYY